MEKVSGYLTVFLSLILSVMISLCLVLIMGAKESTRKMELTCVTDIGMNSALAEFHRELLEQYNLFFIDTSYGTDFPSYEKTAQHIKEYITHNLSGEDIFLSVFYAEPLGLTLEEVSSTEASVATDEEGAVLRQQAVEVMKQEIGLGYLQQIENWVTVAKAYQMNERDIYKEQQEAVNELLDWSNALNTVDIVTEIPGGSVITFWEAGVLNLVVEDISKLSNQVIHPQNYVSSRELLKGTGINQDKEYKDDFLEQLLFHEYILSYTGHYGKLKENGYLSYQTEYILAGKSQDLSNLKDVTTKLLAFRAVANTVHLTTDEEKKMLIKTVSDALATLLTVPAISPLFQTIITLTWAMAESLYDVTQLLLGNRVVLLKTAEDWHYSVEEILDFTGNVTGAKKETGLLYEDYLRILLCFQDKKITTFRLMDIMEMDIRQTPGNSGFRMDACVDSIKAVLRFTGKGKKEYLLERKYAY